MRWLPAVLAAVLTALCALAVAVPASALVMPDDAAGPTCESYLPMGQLAWRQRGGDWLDASGTLHGRTPYSAVTVGDAAAPARIELDASRLVLEALRRKDAQLTWMLRAESGPPGGQVDFHSREHRDERLRPVLELTWADGSTTTQAPEADTFLDCTSAYSLGNWNVLSVRPDRSTLLRFRAPAVARAAPLRSARLVLQPTRLVAGGARIGLYRAQVPYEQPAGAVLRGLAAGFVLDEGLAKHPDVYFTSGFDEWSWTAAWRDVTVRSHADAVGGDPAGRFEPLVGRALRVRIPRGEQLGLDLAYRFRRHGHAEPDEAYFRYYLRLADDWDTTADGGKLPGLAATYGRGGWGNRVSNGSNGWSMRTAFAASLPSEPLRGQATLGVLACHGRVADAACETWGWAAGSGAVLQKNRWYAVEQHVKLNTPGKPDGVFQAWVDGRLVHRHERVLYRDTPELRIETAWLNVYHGGPKVAPSDLTLYIDAVVVARRYIGPIAGLPEASR